MLIYSWFQKWYQWKHLREGSCQCLQHHWLSSDVTALSTALAGEPSYPYFTFCFSGGVKDNIPVNHFYPANTPISLNLRNRLQVLIPRLWGTWTMLGESYKVTSWGRAETFPGKVLILSAVCYLPWAYCFPWKNGHWPQNVGSHSHLAKTLKCHRVEQKHRVWAEVESYCCSCPWCIQWITLPARATPTGHLQKPKTHGVNVHWFPVLEAWYKWTGEHLCSDRPFHSICLSFPERGPKSLHCSKSLSRK